MPTPALTQAIAAIKAGQCASGRAMLEQILARDPYNISALLWMTSVVDTPEKRREYLGRVLMIDPNNVHARRGLEVLGLADSQPPHMAQIQATSTQSQSPVMPTALETPKTRQSKLGRTLVLVVVVIVLLTASICLAQLFLRAPSGSPTPNSFPTVTKTYEGPAPTRRPVPTKRPAPTESVGFAKDYVRLNDDLDCEPQFYYMSLDYDYIKVQGTVANVGNHTVIFVKLRATLYDGAGKQVSSNSFYVSSDRLPPGAESSYEYYIDDPNNIFLNDKNARCVVTVEDAYFDE
jgi:hypothetical protein